jgi:hypothetical protein
MVDLLYLRIVCVEVLLVPVAKVRGVLFHMGVMEPLMYVRIREDGPTGDTDRVDLGAECVVDLAGIPPELVVVNKPAQTKNLMVIPSTLEFKLATRTYVIG